MKLFDICQKTNINCPNHLQEFEIAGITSDSRKVKKNYLFVCLAGTKQNGHNYIDAAILCGAVAAVIENDIFQSDKTILVDDTRAAIANLMNVFCGEPTKKLRFIGITGTNGKTSVSVMIKNIFDTLHSPCELIGTLNCSSFSENNDGSPPNFTTPDPEELYPMLQRISGAGVEWVVMETSSHALKLKKLEPIKFEVGIFTNLTEDHLDFHLNMEDYFKSKLHLFDKCKLGIINIDDEYGQKIKSISQCRVLTCSTKQNADFFVKETQNLLQKGTKYTMDSPKGEIEIFCKVPGRFSIMNSMQASACALALNIDKNTIARSFESFNGVKGRLEKVELSRGRDFAVFIDYAHTPDALQQLLDTANSFKAADQRVVLLFGCGGDREKEKRKLMGKIAVENADYVIVTSDNPRSEDPLSIINDILSGIDGKTNFSVIPNRKEAIETVIATARAGDIILLAGKGHENYEKNSSGKLPFSETEILQSIDKKLRKGGMNL